MTGKVVAHYEIVGKLGEGGMGVVWKARDTHLDRFVALKTLACNCPIPAERLRRFVQEAKAASALNHPNIVHIYDIAEWEGVPYIAMQFAPGRTLHECIGRKGMKLNDVLNYGAEIADAMANAHAAGIVHRDIKPSNIIVTDDGHVKVVDFGLAKLTEKAGSGDFGVTMTLGANADRAVTEAGAIVGTLAYLSPEQAEGEPVDARSDIFSFGAVLYEMITGARAFERGSRAATFSAILNQHPKLIRELRPDVPAELEKLVNRCLRKDPERRLRSMADLALGLRELKEESESGPFDARPTTATAESGIKRHPRSYARVAVAAAIVAVTIAGALLFRGRPESAKTMHLLPVTTYPGMQMEPSLSPDGSQVAFAWNGDAQKNFNIYVKAIGPGPPLRVTTGSTDEMNPAWSPDGSTIAFMRRTAPTRYRVMVVPALGGEARPLTDISIPDRAWLSGPFVAWFPDGQSLVIADAPPGQKTTALWAFSPATGERRALTSPPSGTFGDGCAAVSPDGRSLAFCRRGSAGDWGYDLFAVDLDSDLRPKEQIRPLLTKNTASVLLYFSGLTWSQDGKWVVFSSGPGILGVPGRSRKGSEPVKLAALDGNWPTFARRSSRFMCDHNLGGDADIWRLPLNDKQEKTGDPVRLIASTRAEFAQAYSPDGRRIAFESDRGGNLEIWICGSDGSNCSQTTSLHSLYTGVPTWSPDGREIAFYSRSGDKTHVYIVAAEGGPARRVSSDDGDEFYPRWSRNGEWIYFASKRTGVYQVWKVRPSGGEPLQVTRGGGFAASESPDRRWLYFTRSESPDSGLWRMPLGGGDEREVIPAIDLHNYDVVENGIFYAAHSAPGLAIFFSDADGKSAKVVSAIKRGYVGFSVSPDRRSVTYTANNPAVSELLMAEQLPITGGR